MTDEEIAALAVRSGREGAEQALNAIFARLGIDMEDPDEPMATKKDLQHVRRWRMATETAGKQGLIAVVTTICAGFIGLVITYFNQKH